MRKGIVGCVLALLLVTVIACGESPTSIPTQVPTVAATSEPTAVPASTAEPTAVPTEVPTTEPTAAPTAESTSSGNGSSPSRAAGVGTPIKSIIECGEGYESHELYDVVITLLETARGQDALERIQATNAGSEPPPDGYDYAVARIGFEYSARGLPGTCAHELIGSEQFVGVTADGQQFKISGVVPEPPLNGELSSGDSAEGWVGFLVPQESTEPLMYFTANPSAVIAHSNSVWFRLD